MFNWQQNEHRLYIQLLYCITVQFYIDLNYTILYNAFNKECYKKEAFLTWNFVHLKAWESLLSIF